MTSRTPSRRCCAARSPPEGESDCSTCSVQNCASTRATRWLRMKFAVRHPASYERVAVVSDEVAPTSAPRALRPCPRAVAGLSGRAATGGQGLAVGGRRRSGLGVDARSPSEGRRVSRGFVGEGHVGAGEVRNDTLNAGLMHGRNEWQRRQLKGPGRGSGSARPVSSVCFSMSGPVMVMLYGNRSARCRTIRGTGPAITHGDREIHEARFVLFDDDTRLLFATSFDGPWDAYMEDFFTSGPTLAAVRCHLPARRGLRGLPDLAAVKAFVLGAQETRGRLRAQLRRHRQGDPQGRSA